MPRRPRWQESKRQDVAMTITFDSWRWFSDFINQRFLDQEGAYLVGMAQRRADQMVGSQLAGLVVPYGQEFRDLGVDETFLREVTELTGGGMFPMALKLRRLSSQKTEMCIASEQRIMTAPGHWEIVGSCSLRD